MKIRTPFARLIGCLILTCSSIVVCQHVQAAERDTIRSEYDHRSTSDTSGLDEVVVTAQYAPNSTDTAVQRIRVIDRKKMDAMSAQNLRDVLQNEMNIRLGQDNILGSSMSVQGIGGQNVKILIDGVPVIGRQDGNIDISQINLNNIERIEIIEGPMSVAYGTDALAGTINLITRKSQLKPWELKLSSYTESIGNYNLNGRAGYSKDGHIIILTGLRNLFDGWSPGDKAGFDFDAKPADSGRVQSWKPKYQYAAGLQYSCSLGKTTLDYKGDYFRETIINRGMPDYYGEQATDDYYRTQRVDNAVFINSSFSRNLNLNAQVAYQDFKRVKNAYAKNLTTLDESLSQADGAQDTSRFKLFNSRATINRNKKEVKINYEIGYDINIETAIGVRIKSMKQNIGDYAVFASAEYQPVKQLTIRPGVRYAYNTDYKAPIVPSLNIRYKTGKFTLRASYAKGFRSPTLKELYFDFHDSNHDIDGNENLRAEFSDNVNASVIYTRDLNNAICRLEASAFYNDIRNRIDLAFITGNEYTYINIGRYKTKGVQLNAELIVSTLKIALGANYAGRYNVLSETENIAAFSYAPEIRSSIIYELKPHGITAALFYKYTGRMPGYASGDSGVVAQTFVDPFSTADVSLSKLLFGKRVNVSVGIKNLFDVTNINRSLSGTNASGQAHSSTADSFPYGMGRSFFLKLDINLSGRL